MKNVNKLLDKTEALTLLTTKASSYWSFVSFCFQLPMVITSSAMCIINSISTDANVIKIPNIVVNAVSVLLISVSNNIKANEKYETFKKLSQSYLELSQELDSLEETDISVEDYKLFILKYDNLIKNTSFEDIPNNIKNNVAKSYVSAGRNIPIQINGTIGNIKRSSRDINLSEIV